MHENLKKKYGEWLWLKNMQLIDANNAALKSDVIINNNDGNSFKIVPVENGKEGKSPLEDIPGINLNITTQEIVEILRECRAGV